MNPNVNTTATVNPAVEFYYQKRWLNEPGYFLTWAAFGEQVDYPKAHGDQIKIRFYMDLDSTPVTVPEGVSPPGKKKRKYDIYLTAEEIGDYIFDTNVLTFQAADNNTRINMDLLNRQAQNMIDRRAQATVTGGSTVIRAGDDAGGTVSTRAEVKGRASAAIFNKVLRMADGNRIRTWKKGINPSTGVSTTAIADRYPFIIDKDVWFDIVQQIGEAGGLTFAHKYPGGASGKMHPAEKGSYRELACILTDWPKIWADTGAAVDDSVIQSTTGTDADVHACVLIGKNAYCGFKRVSGDQQKGMKTVAKLINHPPSSYPPLNQISSVGWLQFDAWRRKDETQMIRLELAVSA